MKTANDFAKFALTLRQLAKDVSPADADPLSESRKRIQYQLHVAAMTAQQIAEYLAKEEDPRPAA